MINRKSIIWQIFPQYILFILISLLIVTLYTTAAIKQLYTQRTLTDLKARGRLISHLLATNISQHRTEQINSQIQDLSLELDSRITVILPDGKVIADSEEDYRLMENHADRPEIREAFQKRIGSSTRFSYTLNLNMLYLAVPVIHENTLIAVVRVSMPSSDLHQTLNDIYKKILIIGIFVVILSGMTGFVYIYYFNKPIQTIKESAARIGRGELDHRVYITRPEELRVLSESINAMADQLKDRIEFITLQKNELEAVLTNMVEAVMVIDMEEKIIRINHALSRLFNIKPEDVIGKELQLIIRNIKLQRFIQNTLKSKKVQESEFIVHGESEFTVQAHGTLIQDASGQTIGGLIVFNNITRQKALENMRREFVANVSHELKTPITAIHGFVETLRDGAIHDKNKALEFLDIILKHTDRLNAIIEDLLNLSRIERDTEKGEIQLELLDLQPILQETVALCKNKAVEKNIRLTFEANANLRAKLNAPLFTQAVVNLIDNAIKYSPDKNKVLIKAFKSGNQINISVEDHGIGIPEADIPRIFERFYRVDKARSRQLGGTGLGLSIVKHIVQAHGGSVSVESVSEKGSTFTIVLPAD